MLQKARSLLTYVSPQTWAHLTGRQACEYPWIVGCAGRVEITLSNFPFYRWEDWGTQPRGAKWFIHLTSVTISLSLGSVLYQWIVHHCSVNHSQVKPTILYFMKVTAVREVNAHCLTVLEWPSILNPIFSCYWSLFHSPLLQGNLEENQTLPAALHTQCVWTTPVSQREQEHSPATHVLGHCATGDIPKKPRRDPVLLLTPSIKERKIFLDLKCYSPKQASLVLERSKHCFREAGPSLPHFNYIGWKDHESSPDTHSKSWGHNFLTHQEEGKNSWWRLVALVFSPAGNMSVFIVCALALGPASSFFPLRLVHWI